MNTQPMLSDLTVRHLVQAIHVALGTFVTLMLAGSLLGLHLEVADQLAIVAGVVVLAVATVTRSELRSPPQ